MEPAGSACHAVVRWVITPLAASPASFQPSKAAMMTGAVSLPIPLSSIAHHLLPRLLATPVLSLRAPSDHWLSCPLHGTAPDGPAFRLGAYDEERPQGPQLEPEGRGAGGIAPGRPGTAGGSGRRGDGHHAPGQLRDPERLRRP